jgi:hypothetical protein
MSLRHYDEVLDEARKKGELIANKYIFELYVILRDEEHLPPADCRAKIEHDCIDLWSKATIRKFLPDEAKNPRKSKAGKIGAEQKRKLEEEEKLKSLEVIEQTTDGNTFTISNGSPFVRTDLAETDSFSQEEEESRRYHMELYQKLEERKPSPELLEAVRIIAEKDLRIKELESLIMQEDFSWKRDFELYLPYKLALEIYDIVNLNRSPERSEIYFILRHDGHYVTAIETSVYGSNSVERSVAKNQS